MQEARQRRFAVPLVILGVTALAIGTAVLYGASDKAVTNGACAAANSRLAALEPIARGAVAAFTVPKQSQMMPDLSFVDAEGRTRKLSEWRGRTVLLNIWATWCAPCRKEMPSLDRLEETLGSDDFEVVAVSIDIGDTAKPKGFMKEIGIRALDFYADPTTDVFKELKAAGRAFGMPTTLIVDPQGCELGYMAGPAEWDSPDALKLVHTAMAAPKS